MANASANITQPATTASAVLLSTMTCHGRQPMASWVHHMNARVSEGLKGQESQRQTGSPSMLTCPENKLGVINHMQNPLATDVSFELCCINILLHHSHKP